MDAHYLDSLDGGHVIVLLSGAGPDEPTHHVATVVEVDDDGSAWTLRIGDGSTLRLAIDWDAIEPMSRDARIVVGDAGSVDGADWVAYYAYAPGGFVPAPPRVHPLVGKTVLVGMTYLGPDDEVESQEQWFGTVVEVGERGISVNVRGDLRWLPPEPVAFQGAPAGEYRLRSTGEVIADPDLLTSWTSRRDG